MASTPYSPLDPPARVTRPKNAPFQPSSRIAIIGAGPAGLTMAHTLKSRGYHNVTVFEKEDQVGGMTRTVWDKGSIPGSDPFGETLGPNIRTVPHEMGTCSLATYRDRHILDLMDKVHLNRLNLAPMYVVEDAKNWGQTGGMDFMVWAAKVLIGMGFPSDPQKLLPLIATALEDYLSLRNELFDDPDESYLFPRERPNEERLKELAMPTYDWLEKKGLLVLLPIFTQSTTSQGYGYLKEVPAYYTLMWNNDELLGYPAFQPVVKKLCQDRAHTKQNFPLLFAALEASESAVAKCREDLPSPQQYRAQKENDNTIGADYRALIVQDGFQQLWTRLARQLNVRLGVKEINIKRSNPGLLGVMAPVTIQFKQADSVLQCNVFDFLMLSTKYDLEDLKTFLDVDMATEGHIFKDIHNYELTTTLFSCAPGGLRELPQAFVMDLLLESKDINRCYGTRTSIDCVRPGLKYNTFNDKRVAYQITQPTKSDDEILWQFKKDIAKYGAKDVQVERSVQGTANPKRWKYLPHFEGPGIAHLWDLWDLQAQDNFTWYLGSLTCFESPADVYSYNLQLCDWFRVDGASVGDSTSAWYQVVPKAAQTGARKAAAKRDAAARTSEEQKPGAQQALVAGTRQAAPEAAQIGAGATPASPISEQAAAMRDAAAKTSVESQMAKTAQQALPAPWVVAGTQQAAPEAAQSTASMAATSATKEEAVARRAAAAETSEEQMVAQQALPVQSEVTRTQQDDAEIYSRLKLILAEHRQAARHSVAVATAAAVVQLSKKHGFSGYFAPPDDLMLVWAKAAPKAAPERTGSAQEIQEDKAEDEKWDGQEDTCRLRFLTAANMAETFGVGLESAEVDFAARSFDARIRELPISAAEYRESAVRWETEGGFELIVAVRGPPEPGAAGPEGGDWVGGARVGGESGVGGGGDGSGDPAGQTGGEGGGTGGGGPPVQTLAGPGAGVAQVVASLMANVSNRFVRGNSRVGDSANPGGESGGGDGGGSGGGGSGGGNGGGNPGGGGGGGDPGASSEVAGDPKVKVTVKFRQDVKVISGEVRDPKPESAATGPTKPKPPVPSHPEQTATANCRVEFEFCKYGDGAAMKATLKALTRIEQVVANEEVYGYVQNKVTVTFGPSEASALNYIGDLEHNLQVLEDRVRTDKVGDESSTMAELKFSKIVTAGGTKGSKTATGLDLGSKQPHFAGFGVKEVNDVNKSRVGSESTLLFVRPGSDNFIALKSAGAVAAGTEQYEAKMRAEWELMGENDYAEFTIEVKQGLIREVVTRKKTVLGIRHTEHRTEELAGIDCTKRFMVWKAAGSLLLKKSDGDKQLNIIDEGNLAENRRYKELFQFESESIGSVPQE